MRGASGSSGTFHILTLVGGSQVGATLTPQGISGHVWGHLGLQKEGCCCKSG